MREGRFLKACLREKVDVTPVWLMRQAGRYMKEYREIREKTDFLKMCKTPELVTKITLLPVEKLAVDAAILFSDILVPVEAMGMKIVFHERKGPLIDNPIRDQKGADYLKVIESAEEISFVTEAIGMIRKELEGKVPLIGFSGAPFTLASYMVEGGHSRNYLHVKSMMYRAPALYETLMGKVTTTVIRYLEAQIEAGVQALQLFDSWAGCLSPKDYRDFVAPYSRKIMASLGKKVPLIHFATGTSGILELMKEAGGDVIGVDWRIDLDVAWQRLGYDVGIQGNLDPAVLLASKDVIEERVKDILERAGGRSGHIFNLGHGVLPQTPVENVIFMVDAVHRLSAGKI